MRALLSREYIPFGTQYYRAPSPPRPDWERDLAAIARHGLNTVKFWVQWRWNNPREGGYDFDDIDTLMDLAHVNGLRVMLNTIVDVAPAWVYRKFPDVSMVTLDGRSVGPQTQPHRQIGGLGVCFNHARAMQHLFEFIRETIRRYREHPALEMWNVASEPELTSSMAELRLYASNAEAMRDMLCYCVHCREAFRTWLREKYRTIEVLNGSWNRNYASFDDAEIPVTRDSFNDMIDWRMFFVHTLGNNVKRRFEIARQEDGGKHPLMCHHVFIQGFPVISTANDPWNVATLGDLHGITQMDDPMMCDVLRSAARGKPIISAEMLMLYGYTLDLPKPVSIRDIKRYVFNGVAANFKGFIFWQFRPELLAREAPAWGLTGLDGSDTPWLEAFAEVNSAVQKNASFLLDARPRKAEVAILYSPENQVFGWIATGSERTVTDSLLGVHAALYERNFVVDFIHSTEVVGDVLAQYRVIYVPCPYRLNEAVCAALRSWVEAGGILIGESYFAGWNTESGSHQTIVPGYGFHEVFKARQGVAAPPDGEGMVQMKTTRPLPYSASGSKVFGSIVKEGLLPEGAEVIAKFTTGEPAITSAAYGKGRAILIGSYIGLGYRRSGRRGNADVIAGLVERAVHIVRPEVRGKARVRVDVLEGNDRKRMVILRNLESVPLQTSIELPSLECRELREVFDGSGLRCARTGHGVRISVRLKREEVRVYRA